MALHPRTRRRLNQLGYGAVVAVVVVIVVLAVLQLSAGLDGVQLGPPR